MDTLNLAHSIITDADELCDMVAVWDLSMSDAVFTSVIYYMLKDFPPWSTFAKNRRTAWKYGEWKMSLPSFPPVIFQLFSRVMSPNYEWKSQQSLHNHGFLSTFRGHNEISSWTVEQIGVAATAIGTDEEALKNQKCEIVCTSWHLYISWFCFWYINLLPCRVWHFSDFPYGV